MCVCLSVREHIFGTAGPIFNKFLSRFPVAVARSSSGGVAIGYVLPVLWMTPCSAVMGRMAMRGRPNLEAITTSVLALATVAIRGRNLMSMNGLC